MRSAVLLRGVAASEDEEFGMWKERQRGRETWIVCSHFAASSYVGQAWVVGPTFAAVAATVDREATVGRRGKAEIRRGVSGPR